MVKLDQLKEVKNNFKITVVILLLILGISLFKVSDNNVNSKDLVFITPNLPFSSDPMDYDFYVHHYGFTSVFSGLVSLQKRGTVVPRLAKKWTNKNDFKTWEFVIDENLKYSNGEKILAEHVYLNFQRVIFLMKSSGSDSGFLEHLLGFESVTNISSSIPGMELNGNVLRFHFKKPMKDLLELVSFGLYSLAHPTLYDSKTGVWIDQKKVISSGPYEVLVWDEQNFVLEAREDFSQLAEENGVKRVVFRPISKIKTAIDLSDVGIVVADSNSLQVDENFEYISSPIGLNIGYIRCYGCEKKESPLADLKVRKWLRSKFYLGLELNGIKPVKSFFPLLMNGVQEIKDSEADDINNNYGKIRLRTHRYTNFNKIKENEKKISVNESIAKAMEYLASQKELEIEFDEYNTSKKFTDFDIIMKGTGIEAVEFLSTVKFMFQSKHGIKLPDISGKILEELKKENPNIQIINQELWDQAIIWPVRHFSSGFWINRNINIDVSELNLNHPAIDFQFVKWK